MAKLAAAHVEALTVAGRRPRTISEIERQLAKYVLPTLGDIAADKLTTEQVEDVLAPLAAESKARQANAVRVTLVGLYSWATGSRSRSLPLQPPRHLRGLPNPAKFAAITEQRVQRKRRPVSDAELRVLWAAVKDRRGETYCDLLALVMLCGTRNAETCAALWSEFDLRADQPTWTIPGSRTKNHEDHAVALSPQAVEMLKARKSAAGRGAKLVFAVHAAVKGGGHARSDTARDRMAEILKEGGLTELPTMHELRHSLATFAIANGYRQEVRRRLLNHTSGDVLERVYVHHTHDAEAGEVWRRWAAHLDRLIGNGGGKAVPIKQVAS